MTKENIETQKGLVKELRTTRDKINHDIQGMSLEQEEEYLNEMSAKWKDAPEIARGAITEKTSETL